MPLIRVPEGKRLWQVVAEAYRPPADPWAVYAPDTRIGAFHVGTLALNFAGMVGETEVNPITLHNPWTVDLWPGGYQLRVPEEWSMNDFHQGYDPSWVAFVIGYSLQIGVDDPITTPGVVEPDAGNEVPQWVQVYLDWLRQQVERYGEVQVRMLAAGPDGGIGNRRVS